MMFELGTVIHMMSSIASDCKAVTHSSMCHSDTVTTISCLCVSLHAGQSVLHATAAYPHPNLH